jgi:cathepsin F
MKALLIFALLVAIVAAIRIKPNVNDDVYEKLFQSFMVKYGKTYDTPAEKDKRFEIFKANMLRYAEMNKKSSHAKYGVNKFADLSLEEFRTQRLMSKPMSGEPLAISCLSRGVTIDATKLDIPTSYDWRTKGVVSPVKDQGQCGSCWAFSTIGNIESQNAIKTKPKTVPVFSEQLLVDCSTGCSNEPPYGQVCNQGCGGGWQWNAFEDIMTWGGVETEADYPYTAEDGTCQLDKKKLQVPVANYTCLTNNKTDGADENTMATFLVANGPLAVALNADYVEGYSNGIINPPTPADCDGTSLDHAVLIVGYGVENQVPFWIVKNSWGGDWGENGYFRIVRGQSACGINAAVLSAILA